MLKIGLTGGIGSGKSLVCRLFSELGTPIIDADAIAHSITAPGKPALAKLAAVFGAKIVDNQGQLNRALLRERVFQDANQLEQLEGILHPLIRQEMQRQIDALEAPYIIVAIPLLFEKGWQCAVDRILVIDTDEALQVERTVARDRVSVEAVQRILNTQASRQQRLDGADDVIVNIGDLSNLPPQVEQLHRHYLELASGRESG